MMNCKGTFMLKKSKYKNLIIKEKKQIPIRMTSFLKGDVAELKAAAWLMEQGFYVFKNLSKCLALGLCKDVWTFSRCDSRISLTLSSISFCEIPDASKRSIIS